MREQEVREDREPNNNPLKALGIKRLNRMADSVIVEYTNGHCHPASILEERLLAVLTGSAIGG